MIGHLTQCDFKVMPWANGRGQTVEMFRIERDGALLWRLSRAAVVEDGPFSVFPGIDRNLTVISGPGFDLVGGGQFVARPLQPIAFSGDLQVRAVGVTAACDDFNVMVRRGAMRATVEVCDTGRAAGQMVALFALGSLRVGPVRAKRFDLVLTDAPIEFDGQAIVVSLTAE